MKVTIPRSSQQRNFNILIDSAKGGTVTNVDEARQNNTQSPETVNLTIKQDALWSTREGTGYYGTAPSTETGLLGGYEYVLDAGTPDETRELIVVGLTGKIYKSSNNGATWSELSGVSMTANKPCFFLQVMGELWITNNTDRLTIYDGSTVVRNTQIDAPGNLTATRAGSLTSGSYTLYYSVVALNNVGFTEGSTEASVAINKVRDKWLTSASDAVNLAWDAVSGATRYEVYVSDESGSKVYLAETTTNAFSDDGTAEINYFKELPDDNTTGGAILGKLTFSNGRVWGVDDQRKIVFTGTGSDLNKFSYFYGGGWTYLDKGSKETPVRVVHYRTGKGDSAPTVLARDPAGRGSIWQISMDTLTVGNETITIPSVFKIVGSIGAFGELSPTEANDNVYFANKNGVFALKSKAQLFNVLSTEEQSVNIRPSFNSINPSMFDKIVGFYTEGKVYFSCSIGGVRNDTTFVYDLENNTWVWSWSIGFDNFFEYTDTTNTTRLLGVKSDSGRLIEISDKYTTDLGQAFRTSWQSPLLHINPKNKKVFGTVEEVLFELGRPQGNITLEVLGMQRNKPLSLIATRTIADTVSNVDFHNYLFGDGSFGDDDETPKTFAQASVKKIVKVNKTMNAVQFRVNSTSANTKYTILSVMADGVVDPVDTPSSWKN